MIHPTHHKEWALHLIDISEIITLVQGGKLAQKHRHTDFTDDDFKVVALVILHNHKKLQG